MIETVEDMVDVFSKSTAKLQERIAELEQENERLREALGDAIDSYEEYAQYAGDYLMKKHGVDEDIAELRKVLEAGDED